MDKEDRIHSIIENIVQLDDVDIYKFLDLLGHIVDVYISGDYYKPLVCDECEFSECKNEDCEYYEYDLEKEVEDFINNN
jgi:hypothetical protein